MNEVQGGFPAASSFLTDLGVEFIEMDKGLARIALRLQPRHMNNWQVTHGGVVMTLLDVAMSLAGRSLDPQSRAGVTVEMKTSFLQPAGTPGARIVATGHAFHRSTTMCFCEAELHEDERLLAKALGTFKYLKRLDVADKLQGQA